MNNKELNDIFKDVGKEYGFENVSAEFMEYADFKVKWTRGYSWADFQVSDYLDKGSPQVIKDTAHALFSRILNRFDPNGPAYPPAMTEYLLSDDLIKNYLGDYISRHDDLRKAPEYLSKKVTKMITEKYGKPIDNLTVLWTGRKRPQMSALFRTLAVNDGMTDKEIVECYGDMIEGLKQFGGN